jgi:hypothetical protein
MLRKKPEPVFQQYADDNDEDDEATEEPGEEEVIPTRYGYNVVDFLSNYQQVFLQHGALGWGRILHLTADMICSEGYTKWRQFSYTYALEHIGLASPRIFVYLEKRHDEIALQIDKFPTEVLYGRPEFQRIVGEVAIILNTQPRKTRLALPKVPQNILGTFWINTQRKSPETAVVRRIWKHDTDSPERAIGANHMLAACTEMATEKALFWMRWSLDEDKRKLREKENLDMNKRGGGMFLARCVIEAYKDLAAQQRIRMHEEFQMLSRMYMRDGNYFSARQRTDVLVLMIQIICEVPRWKVPAAIPLAKDETALKTVIAQAPIFFKEVLAKPAVEEKIWKYAKKRTIKPETKKEKSQEEQIDEIYKAFYKGIM